MNLIGSTNGNPNNTFTWNVVTKVLPKRGGEKQLLTDAPYQTLGNTGVFQLGGGSTMTLSNVSLQFSDVAGVSQIGETDYATPSNSDRNCGGYLPLGHIHRHTYLSGPTNVAVYNAAAVEDTDYTSIPSFQMRRQSRR